MKSYGCALAVAAAILGLIYVVGRTPALWPWAALVAALLLLKLVWWDRPRPPRRRRDQ